MACVSPPELDDRTLLIYIDGQATPDIIAHIERCSHCRERARRLAGLEDRLTTQLYRIDCPSPSDLGEFHLGMLPAAQAEAVRRHLGECPHCWREIAQLESYLTDLAPTLEPGPLEHVVERVRVWVARLVGRGPLGQPALSPAFASVRGGEQEPLIYEAGEVQVIIEIQEDVDQPDYRTILGLVIGLTPSQELKAHLWTAEQRLATVPVDELGNFILPNVRCGRYELMLSGPEIDIHIQDLEIETG
jgi:hypothetical protein